MAARFAGSSSRSALLVFAVSAGTSQAFRQASVFDLPSSELSGLAVKVSALEFGSQ